MDEVSAPFGMAALVVAGAFGAAFRGGDAGRRVGTDVRRQRQGNALLAVAHVTEVVTAVIALVAFVLGGIRPARADDAANGDMAQKRAAGIGLHPGRPLDSSTAGPAKGLLPPEILQQYEKNEFKNEIVDWPTTVGTLGPDF